MWLRVLVLSASVLVCISAQELYAPPGFLEDFIFAETYRKYDELVRNQFNYTLFSTDAHWLNGDCAGISYRLSGAQHLQVSETFDMPPNSQVVPVSWNGFPGALLLDFPNRLDAYRMSEVPGYPHDRPLPGFERARGMDEYVEWFAKKDPETGKIIRVDLSTELPEYYNFLFHNEPDTLLRLYRTYVSEEVEFSDLALADDEYNPYTRAFGGYNHLNKWNTELGIMHLTCPINTLREAIHIAAESTLLWSSCPPDLDPVDKNPEMSMCGAFASVDGHADPKISSTINDVCRSPNNAIVSLNNPIGVYMETLLTDGWADPFGFQLNPIDIFVHYERGETGSGHFQRVVRASISVPEGRGFVLGDILIGGVPLNQAGVGYLVDSSVNVFLEALVSPFGVGQPEPVPCRSCWGQMPGYPACEPKTDTNFPVLPRRGMKRSVV